MKAQLQSTLFRSVLDDEQLFTNLDHLKLNDYERFLAIGEMGKQIQALAKEEDVGGLEALCDKHRLNVPFMKMQIEDAFLSALNLRNQEIVAYFLKNGLPIDQVAPDAVLTLCYSLQYLAHDPPVELLELCLSYGANPRAASPAESDTGMHIAARHGQLSYLELLVKYGGDVNAVNDDKMTPLGCAVAKKKQAAAQFLRSQGGSEKWK